ncbi:MAG: hypothetical protein B7Y39_04495 [Bdellovibrio sp. 28-41-41]|nr:MAG: hypothetical protein B7Y39_04495 [Bdellovibrio sp. 28-41-41]
MIKDNIPRDHITIEDGLKMVFVAFLWALCFPLIKLGLQSGTPPILFGALRALLAALGLSILARVRKESFSHVKEHWLLLLVVGVTTFFGFAGMFLGGSSINPGLATVIGNSNPIMASALAAIFLSESLTRSKISGLILGFAGVMLVSVPAFSGDTNLSIAGIGFVLFGALSSGAGSVLLKKVSNSNFPTLTLVAQFTFATILLFAVSFVKEGVPAIKFNFSFAVSLAVLALGTTALADVLWIDLLKRNSLTKLSVYMFLTPAFSILLGIIFFQEKFGIWESLGIAFILTGVLLGFVRKSTSTTVRLTSGVDQ